VGSRQPPRLVTLDSSRRRGRRGRRRRRMDLEALGLWM
jgi:hypothetical protein